jgi:uncharacterized membrane protein YraQ (UPF0718 family)
MDWMQLASSNQLVDIIDFFVHSLPAGAEGVYMDTLILYGFSLAALSFSMVKNRHKTLMAAKKAFKAFEGIMPQFIVVLIFVSASLAVLDNRTISRFIGEGSGALGVLAASLVGAVTLIPGFVAFPAAAALMKEGAGATQIAAFVSSLMMVGVVTLPMEIKYFGKQAALMRNGMAFVFALVAAVFVGWVVGL